MLGLELSYAEPQASQYIFTVEHPQIHLPVPLNSHILDRHFRPSIKILHHVPATVNYVINISFPSLCDGEWQGHEASTVNQTTQMLYFIESFFKCRFMGSVYIILVFTLNLTYTHCSIMSSILWCGNNCCRVYETAVSSQLPQAGNSLIGQCMRASLYSLLHVLLKVFTSRFQLLSPLNKLMIRHQLSSGGHPF